MFWAYNTTSPQIDIILCKEDLTLHELLDQENVLQELKAQNLKLIEFLLKPEILQQLVTLIITEPSPDLETNEQYKYPNLACELLTSDLPAINERLASEEMLNRLYGFLQNEPPLNPLLSSFFSRTLSILISRKSEQNWYSYQYTCLQALEFLKAKDEFMELLLKHMGTSSIMDLTHNLVTLIEGPELKQTLRNWLQNQNVIPNLIGLLSPNTDADCQVNAASVLCSIIRKLRDDMPNSYPIINLLESSQTIELILKTVFDSDEICETSIESAVDVLLELIQPYFPDETGSRQMLYFSVHDSAEKNGVVGNLNTFSEPPQPVHQPNVPLSDIVTAVLPFIKKLKFILENPIKKEPIKLTSGIISPPFGKARLLVAKFITSLISLNNVEINTEIIRCDIPELLLDLFYAYSSNNFLHTELEKLIAYVIDNLNANYKSTNSNDDLLMINLLNKCNLLQRILAMWKENDEKQSEGQCRRGYMGHVIRIASLIHLEDEKKSSLHELLSKEVSSSLLDEWNVFVNETLKSIIETHRSCLGGVCPKSCQSSENSFDESVYKDIKSASFKESLYEQDDDQNGMYFNISSIIAYDANGELRESSEELADDDEEDRRKLQMFNAVCAQKWQSFNKGLDSLGHDLDDEEFEGPIEFWKSKGRNAEDKSDVWDSDDENLDEEVESNSDPWGKLGNASNPWANVSSSSDSGDNWNVSTDSNWANFDDSFGSSNGSGGVGGGGSEIANDETSPTSNEESSALPENFEGMKLAGKARTFTNSALRVNNVAAAAAADETDCAVDGRNARLEMRSNWSRGGGGGHHHKEDGSDEMLDLESICGNTLAEKIANAENDIRHKDEESMMRHEEEQRRNCRRREVYGYDSAVAAATAADDQYGGDMDIDTELPRIACGGEESLADDMMCLVSQQECLTENSVDFMTAENTSTSDAESSVEFGDAENSLDDDADDVEAKPPADPNANTTANECNECGGEKSSSVADVACSENGGRDDQQNRVGDKIEPAALDDATARDTCPLGNGDIVDGDEQIVNCDTNKSGNSDDHRCPVKEPTNENMNGNTIEEQA